MPCNSDYMNPTKCEITQLNGLGDSVKDVADYLTHWCDSTRDQLEEVFTGTTTAVPLLTDGEILLKKLHKAVAGMRSNYAYANGYANKVDSVMVIAERVENEYLRVKDAVEALNAGRVLTTKDKNQLKHDQIQHRMGDMLRVYQHYATKPHLTKSEIEAVSNIDFTKPLIPQLGFDPDDV